MTRQVFTARHRIDLKLIYYHSQINDPPLQREEPPASKQPETQSVKAETPHSERWRVIDFLQGRMSIFTSIKMGEWKDTARRR